MRNLQLLSATAAILLLGAGAVLAQGVKTDETTGAPAAQQAPPAQQTAPAEKMAPTLKSDQSKAPEKAGQAAETAPPSAAKASAVADSTDVKSKRVERHVGTRYAGGHHFYNSYRGHRGYGECRVYRDNILMPWCW